MNTQWCPDCHAVTPYYIVVRYVKVEGQIQTKRQEVECCQHCGAGLRVYDAKKPAIKVEAAGDGIDR